MRKILCIFILTLFGCNDTKVHNYENSLGQKDFENLRKLDNNEPIMVWCDNEQLLYGIFVEFYPDGSFIARSNREGGTDYSKGTYTAVDNKIQITVKDHASKEKMIFPIFSVWERKRAENSIFTENYFESPGQTRFWDTKSQPKTGQIRIVDGIKLITAGFQKAKIKENIRVRKGPGLNFDYYSIKWDQLRDPEDQYRDVLPKNQDTVLIGQSEKTSQIDDINDYWYYCIAVSDWYSIGPRFGWVFGGYIDKK